MQFRVVKGKYKGQKVFCVEYRTLFAHWRKVKIDNMVTLYPTYNKAFDAMKNFAIRYGDRLFGKLNIK